ncbi:MAG: biotin transporter BioY [Clostridia bacterium]|nr:biotin transporter BioY [Clostridia bacterium]
MKLRKITAAAVFCALLAVLSQIVLPLPGGVPLTLQTFAVALCGFCLGQKNGLLAVGAYLLLGGVGLPLFSSFGGGIGWLLGPTGGFLWGFLPLIFCCGLRKYPIAFGGLAACHLLGLIQFALVTGNSLWQAFLVASLPYLAKDALSLVAARWLAKRLPRKFF